MELSKADTNGLLCRLESQVAEWRRCHGKGSKLPETLWREIAGVAHELGVNRTSRALGLWYYSVKRWVAESQQSSAGQAGFVEVTMSPPPSVDGCSIELERADGTRVIIRHAKLEHVDAVASRFLGARP